MTDEAEARDRPLPDEWEEVAEAEYVVEKYDPRPSALFEHADRERAVHIHPTEPNLPHADQEEWEVGLMRGHERNLLDTESIARVHGREQAYHVAVDFMEAYEEAAPEQGDDAAAIAYAMEDAELEADAVED